MIRIRKSSERASFDYGWLQATHSFSFGQYVDPANSGFKSLRVFNDDLIEPKRGFELHPHNNVEILTYVYQGSLLHQDSIGNKSILTSGQYQFTSAGSGIEHSEHNASSSEKLKIFQIWIRPKERDLEPRYEHRREDSFEDLGGLKLICSPDGEGSSIQINQDVKIFNVNLVDYQEIKLGLAPGQTAWMFVVDGKPEISKRILSQGDSASIFEEPEIVLSNSGEVLLFVFD